MAWDGATDRRRYKRVNLRLLLEFEDESGETARMETLNFSAGGFYCHFSRRTPPLTRLALRFVFPPFGPDHVEERSVDCEAVVVRCDPEPGAPGTYQVAACFTSMTAEDRTYVQDYLAWYEVVYADDEDEDETEADREREEEDVA